MEDREYSCADLHSALVDLLYHHVLPRVIITQTDVPNLREAMVKQTDSLSIIGEAINQSINHQWKGQFMVKWDIGPNMTLLQRIIFV